MAIRYEMAVGLNKGKKITKNIMKPRQSRRKGVSYTVALGPVTFSHMLPSYRYLAFTHHCFGVASLAFVPIANVEVTNNMDENMRTVKININHTFGSIKFHNTNCH